MIVTPACTVVGCEGVVVAREWCRKHYSRWYRNGSIRVPSKSTVLERFSLAYEPDESPYGLSEPCWLWQRSFTWGYPQFKVAGKPIKGHVFSFMYYKGQIPSGYLVRHMCDRPACVNPAHLELGTQADNAQDRVVRNRTRAKKITQHQVEEIRDLIAGGTMTLVAIAHKYNVSPGMIGHIKHGRLRLRPTRPIKTPKA